MGFPWLPPSLIPRKSTKCNLGRTVSMLLAISGIFFVFILVIGATYLYWAPQWREAEALARRLAQTSTASAAQMEIPVVQQQVLSHIPWFDAALRRIPFVLRLDRLREQAGNQTPIGIWLLVGGMCAVLGFWLVSQIGRLPWWGALVCGSGGFSLPFLYLSHLKHDRLRRFHEQFPEALGMLIRSIQAGHSLIIGMQLVSEEFPDPLGPEFRRTVEHITKGGLPFDEAMKALSDRLDSLDLKYFVIATIIQRESGGNLTEVLEKLEGLIRQRFELQDRVKALSAEGKLSAIVLFALPFVIVLALMVLNPGYLSVLFETETGRWLIGVGLSMMIIGGFITKRMIAIRV
ncbi:MAG: hypothetical protein D6704_08935 [Nitrospirae bacterium]|nr:MAG: hypothetical protein D6704_08935 [Nitrospirota bacterium]